MGPWRERVALAAHNTTPSLIPRAKPVGVDITFYMPRPASLLKKLVAMVKRPDLDKLARACLDALTDVCFEDDSQVVDLFLRKRYIGITTFTSPGARIKVMELDPLEVCPV